MSSARDPQSTVRNCLGVLCQVSRVKSSVSSKPLVQHQTFCLFVMTLFGQSSSRRPGGGRRGRENSQSEAPFSIDDAFDIPEDDADLASASLTSKSPPPQPIIRNGQLRLSTDSAKYRVETETEADAERGSTADSASLIQSGNGDPDGGSGEGATAGEGGYYEGPPQLKYWWHHPKIRSNPRVVLAACMLVILGLGKATRTATTWVQLFERLMFNFYSRLGGCGHLRAVHPFVRGRAGRRLRHCRHHLLRARRLPHRLHLLGRQREAGVRVQPLAPLQQLNHRRTCNATTKSTFYQLAARRKKNRIAYRT